MTNLRKALLGGAALAVMATGAQADELSTLKAQIEALQARVDTMQSAPAALPEGTSLMTFRRGSADFGSMNGSYRDAQNYGYDGQGFTIGVTPTADMPAPVAEITVSGYVRSWVSWGIDGYSDSTAGGFAPSEWNDTGENHLYINSRGSVSVKSKVDTAIGQIRTAIELRADTPGDASMRYAWGEWDMTPNWTFGAGSYFDVTSLISAPTTVNSSGPVGPVFSRDDQIRLTYTDGPLSWAVALEGPTHESSTSMPDIATSIVYDVAGGHQFQFVAAIADWEPAYEDFDLGYYIGGAVNLNLGDVATLSVGAIYGEGLVGEKLFYVGDSDEKAWGMHAGLGFALSETTSANIHYGYEDDDDNETMWTVGANIMWRPVKQMKMGWEVNYGEYEGCCDTDEALQINWGTWFYF